VNSVPALDSILTQCDLEPITRLGRIQSFGFLLAMSGDWTVVRTSANLAMYLGIQPGEAIGVKLDSLFDPEVLHDIRNRMTGLSMSGLTERLFGIALVAGGRLFDIAVHYAGRLCILEGEPAGLDNRVDAASLVRKMVSRLSKQSSLDTMHADAARQIRVMTGFDRVMIYRFASSGAGEVIAESAAAGLDPLIGLHYPASDIPVQARSLYLRNSFRIIADVAAETVALVGAPDNADIPLDLTFSITRAVSPVHIEYLENMSVCASLSISIIVDGALWGLIACHHGAARLPTFVVRSAAELFGQMYSMMLESRLSQAQDYEDRLVRESLIRLLASIAGNNDLVAHVGWLRDALESIIPCDGTAVCFRGRISSSGLTPSAADIEALNNVARSLPDGPIFVTDHIAAVLVKSVDPDQAAGALCIPISRGTDDYIMLFRREMARDIRWAGEPGKLETRGGEIPRLSPRTSFAAFGESIRGRSRAFNKTELRSAEALRSGLGEVIHRGAANLDKERQRAAERQELLIAELNHRVRNVLALIRGLISQTNGEGGDAASYVKSLNGRVQALARAHDRVTRQNWGPGPLNAIFDDEIAAYVPTQRDRFVIKGSMIFLQPEAFSTFALIIHELVTNSAKYGSLSDSGSVEVTLAHTPGRGLDFKWCELGGPPVEVPTRRGFGSVIIERVVPFDLQGTALVQYLPAGLEADFFIPDRHIASAAKAGLHPLVPPPSDRSARVAPPVVTLPLNGLGVLLLEDNLIVALEAEDLLRSLGAAVVYTASNIAAASQILGREALQFAVLDVNLGIETSLAFASRLVERHIPFIFASGYGENVNVGAAHHSILTVSKPYDRDDLGFAISQTLEAVTQR
jgi:light-regulated signal transduction histidine kinase (bacteriophytochrome)/CheY-like chemotaxis protein